VKKLILSIFILCWPTIIQAQSLDEQNTVLLAQLGSLNCGIKPLPRLGHKIGRCINGQWEQVSSQASGGLNCGLKPLPKLGHKIGRCVNGQWEQVSI
jgi:hypothetical protein